MTTDIEKITLYAKNYAAGNLLAPASLIKAASMLQSALDKDSAEQIRSTWRETIKPYVKNESDLAHYEKDLEDEAAYVQKHYEDALRNREL